MSTPILRERTLESWLELTRILAEDVEIAIQAPAYATALPEWDDLRDDLWNRCLEATGLVDVYWRGDPDFSRYLRLVAYADADPDTPDKARVVTRVLNVELAIETGMLPPRPEEKR